jgi:hypothetical protein
MLFSPDFVAYFKQTAVLLERDPSLWCVSTWNDNGMAKIAKDPKRLFRTSYFPGLGWMLRRELWEEIGPHWPKEHWDHWMRLNTTSRGRECVIPEVNRNYNIGEVGANMKRDVYAKYLKHMSLNHVNVKDLGGGCTKQRVTTRSRRSRVRALRVDPQLETAWFSTLGTCNVIYWFSQSLFFPNGSTCAATPRRLVLHDAGRVPPVDGRADRDLGDVAVALGAARQLGTAQRARRAAHPGAVSLGELRQPREPPQHLALPARPPPVRHRDLRRGPHGGAGGREAGQTIIMSLARCALK